jgi:hypothetical protein
VCSGGVVKRFIPFDPDQPLLLPPDLRDALPAGHTALLLLSWLTVRVESSWAVCGGLLSRSCCERGGGALGRVGVLDHGVELALGGARPGLPGGQGGRPAVHVDVTRRQRVTALFGS